MDNPIYPNHVLSSHRIGWGWDRTIAQNIAYGAAANGTRGGETDVGGIPMDQIVEAAQLANAKEFIEEFPDG